MARDEVIKLLKQYIDLLNAEGLSVYKAFLFGSYSKDMADSSSDIDVLIVSNKYDENDDLIIGKMWQLTKKINSKIEPFLIGVEKFKKDDISPLISDVKENGIELSA